MDYKLLLNNVGLTPQTLNINLSMEKSGQVVSKRAIDNPSIYKIKIYLFPLPLHKNTQLYTVFTFDSHETTSK